MISSTKNKYIIVGKSGVGKDYIAKLFENSGKVRLITYATRPPRFEEENTHIFISPEQGAAIDPSAKFLQADVVGYEYFTTREAVDKADILILEPNGVKEILEKMPDQGFHVLYVSADPAERMNAALIRQDRRLAKACPVLGTQLNLLRSQKNEVLFKHAYEQILEDAFKNIGEGNELSYMEKQDLSKGVYEVYSRFQGEEQAFSEFESTFYGWLRASRYQAEKGENIGIPENVLFVWNVENTFEPAKITEKVQEILRTDEMAMKMCGRLACVMSDLSGHSI